MANMDLTAGAKVLKVLYPQTKIEDIIYEDNPFLGIVAKKTGFVGEKMRVALSYGDPQGRSGTFSKAQANKTASLITGFDVTRKSDYALFGIDGEAWEASTAAGKGAIIDLFKREMKGTLRNLSNSAGKSAFGNGSGSRGKITSAVHAGGKTTVTLTQALDIVNFEVGMTINTSLLETGGVSKNNDWKIESIDRNLGKFVLTGDATANVLANDYIHVSGDYDKMMTGLAGWLPYTAPTAGDNFFGVDRSVDAERLAGIRLDASALPIEEALLYQEEKLTQIGARPDYVFMNQRKVTELKIALGSKVTFVDILSQNSTGRIAKMSYKGIAFDGNKGIIKVIADRNCPYDRSYMIQSDTWSLHTLGTMPKWLELDNNKMLREASADAYEGRLGYRGNFTCDAPGFNSVAKV